MNQTIKKLLLSGRSQYAASLNGTSQYFSLTPVAGSMDLNGAEMITATDDKDFETTKGNWTDNGNHSAVRSTTYKKSGTASLLITATAAGDGTTNFVSLPHSAFTTIVSGNKFTKVLWAYGNTNGVTLAMKIGDQVVTGKVVYNAVAGTFTYTVFNFLATVSTVNQDIRLYLSGAGTCNIDDCSLSQKRDMIILCAAKTLRTSFTTNDKILMASGTTGFYTFGGITTNNTIGAGLNDGVQASVTATGGVAGGLCNGLYNFLAATFNATGNITLYLNGIAVGTPLSISLLGKIPSINLLDIGISSTSTQYWLGNIAPFQVILFNSLPTDGGVSIITDAYNRFKSNKPFVATYPNQVSGGIWIDWRSLIDKWGVQSVLTNTGGAPIVKVKY